jgi:hypothetical protein
MDIVQQLESNKEDGTYAAAASEIRSLRTKLSKAVHRNAFPWYRRLGLVLMMLGAFTRDPIIFLIGAAVFLLPA